MSTKLYTDQLRDGLRQARDKLIATREHAEGQMNAAQAKLAQQTSDSEDRTEARDRARAQEIIVQRGQFLAARVTNLGRTTENAANASADSANRLVTALEAAGRTIRSWVDAKDNVLGEVERVAGIARNHLERDPTLTAPNAPKDPLSALAEEVKTIVRKAGTRVELTQKKAVASSIRAAKSMAAAAQGHWQESAANLDGVAKELTLALDGARKVAAATVTSNQDLQSARYVSWEQLIQSDNTTLAYEKGLRVVDAVINGSLRVSRQNQPSEPNGQLQGGLSAEYHLFELAEESPVTVSPSSAESGDAPNRGPRTVAFFVVPETSASGFGRSAARRALAAGHGYRVTADPKADPKEDTKSDAGTVTRWEFKSAEVGPMVQDAAGDKLVFGQAYVVFAAELTSVPDAAEPTGSTPEISRLSLRSLPVTVALTFCDVQKPEVHLLPGGAFIVRFNHVRVAGETGTKPTSLPCCVCETTTALEDCVGEYRMLILREAVWKSWQGGLSFESALGPQSVAPPEASRETQEAKTVSRGAGKQPKRAATRGTGEGEEKEDGACSPLPTLTLDDKLAMERKIRLAGMLNEADWTVLQPGGDGSLGAFSSVEELVGSIGMRYAADMALVPHAQRALNTDDTSKLTTFLKSGFKSGFVMAYFNPFWLAWTDSSQMATPDSSRDRQGDPSKVLAGRYTDVHGNLIDLEDSPYVALVYVAGKRLATTLPIAEDVLSPASDPFPSPLQP